MLTDGKVTTWEDRGWTGQEGPCWGLLLEPWLDSPCPGTPVCVFDPWLDFWLLSGHSSALVLELARSHKIGALSSPKSFLRLRLQLQLLPCQSLSLLFLPVSVASLPILFPLLPPFQWHVPCPNQPHAINQQTNRMGRETKISEEQKLDVEEAGSESRMRLSVLYDVVLLSSQPSESLREKCDLEAILGYKVRLHIKIKGRIWWVGRGEEVGMEEVGKRGRIGKIHYMKLSNKALSFKDDKKDYYLYGGWKQRRSWGYCSSCLFNIGISIGIRSNQYLLLHKTLINYGNASQLNIIFVKAVNFSQCFKSLLS